MAYTSFDDTKPVSSDNGLVTVDAIRNNLLAMRDAVVMGAFNDWNYAPTVGTGTASQPQYAVYSKGTERLRATLTWGTTGGADGNVTQMVWAYSSDSGSTYDTIGTQAITYDTDANVTGITWS